MATEGGRSSTTTDDVLQGSEPGASRNSMLVSTDSFDDLANIVDESDSGSPNKRFSTGTIKEISRDNLAEIVNSKLSIDKSQEEGVISEHTETESLAESEQGTSDVQSSGIVSENESLDQEETGVNGAENTVTDVSSETNEAASPEEEVEYVHSDRWQQHRKHVFILSSAGKPIYSRFGDEDRLVTLMGVMQALVSVIQDTQDSIKFIVAGEHKFVFMVREHLILVAVSNTQASMQQILMQLTYVYNQVISVLTFSQLSRIFKQRRNYDLRRMLTGAEKFFDNLLNLMDHDPSFFLGAVRCLPLENNVRDTIAQSIAQHAKVKDLVFAILIADNQLITLVRMKKYFLHPLDLHLIFNLVSASESFKAAESWTPICLPKFDSGGYLHGHISYLDDACHTCLLLLTVDRDSFFTLSECKYKIQERLIRYRCLTAISDSMKRQRYKTSHVGISELRHFLYKSKSTAQFTEPDFDPPYCTEEDRNRLFGLYQYLHHRIHSPARPLKILFHVGPYETLLGWVTSGFELYAVFGPLVTKHVAISSVNKLLKWIKKEEDRLFILNSPTF